MIYVEPVEIIIIVIGICRRETKIFFSRFAPKPSALLRVIHITPNIRLKYVYRAKSIFFLLLPRNKRKFLNRNKRYVTVIYILRIRERGFFIQLLPTYLYVYRAWFRYFYDIQSIFSPRFVITWEGGGSFNPIVSVSTKTIINCFYYYA